MRKLLAETTSSGEKTFPWKLHNLLETSASEGFEDIVSWQGNNAFKVHDTVRFEESIIERFFNHTQFKSFQRQLNIYGFARVRKGGKGKAATGSYIHPLLIRGNPEACSFMIRTKIKNRNRDKKLKPLQPQKSRDLPTPRGLEDFMNQSNRNDSSLAVRDQGSIVPDTRAIRNRNCATIESSHAKRGVETIEAGISSRADSMPIPFRPLGPQGHSYKRRRRSYIMNTEELGLDTIFDNDLSMQPRHYPRPRQTPYHHSSSRKSGLGDGVVRRDCNSNISSSNNNRNKKSRRSSIASAIAMDDFLCGLWQIG